MVYDSGSKLLKCAIADEMGKIIALESWEKEVIRSEDGFQREWNYINFWDKLIELTKLTIKNSKIEARDITLITASSIRPSCVFTDDDNNAVYIGASFELRGIDYAEDIDEEFEERTGKSFYERSGHFPSLLFPPARYKFFQEESKNDNRITRITQYLPEDSWILVKFGGESHTNIASAAESGFLDLETKLWHPAWEDILDLPEYFLPWPVLPGEIIGTVKEQFQKELGLSSETQLVAGFPDTHAALLGCQCVEKGSIGAVLGTTTPVQAITDKLFIDPNEKTWSGVFACKGLFDNYYLETNTGVTGQILKWAANLFYSEENSTLKQRFQKLDEALNRYDQFEAKSSPEQIQEKTIFSLLGPQPLAGNQAAITPGIFHFQSPGGVEEANLNRDSFIASIFDNIQFAVSRNIEIATEYTDLTNPSIAVVGGITRNRTFLQRFSDLFQKPITTSSSFETTIQGLLVLCDIADGKIRSIQDLKDNNRELNLFKIIEPRASMKQKMRTRYQTWQRLFKQFNN